MTHHTAHDIVRKYHQAWMRGDIDTAMNYVADHMACRAPGVDLDGSFGARHLAPHPDGRAAHWRDFIAQLDELALTPEEEARAEAGARAAFSSVLGYVEQYCVLPAAA